MVHLDPVGAAIAVAFTAILGSVFWWMMRMPSPARPPRPEGDRPSVLVPVTDPAATRRAVDLACRLEGAPDVVLLHVAAVPLDASA